MWQCKKLRTWRRQGKSYCWRQLVPASISLRTTNIAGEFFARWSKRLRSGTQQSARRDDSGKARRNRQVALWSYVASGRDRIADGVQRIGGEGKRALWIRIPFSAPEDGVVGGGSGRDVCPQASGLPPLQTSRVRLFIAGDHHRVAGGGLLSGPLAQHASLDSFLFADVVPAIGAGEAGSDLLSRLFS